MDSNVEIEKLLREQNTLTIKTVTSALLEDKTAFIDTMEQYATLVAKSRGESDNPHLRSVGSA
jgi:rsbT co-antagonist protein RsbR